MLASTKARAVRRLLGFQRCAGFGRVGDLACGDHGLKPGLFFLLLQFEDALLDFAAILGRVSQLSLCLQCIDFQRARGGFAILIFGAIICRLLGQLVIALMNDLGDFKRVDDVRAPGKDRLLVGGEFLIAVNLGKLDIERRRQPCHFGCGLGLQGAGLASLQSQDFIVQLGFGVRECLGIKRGLGSAPAPAATAFAAAASLGGCDCGSPGARRPGPCASIARPVLRIGAHPVRDAALDRTHGQLGIAIAHGALVCRAFAHLHKAADARNRPECSGSDHVRCISKRLRRHAGHTLQCARHLICPPIQFRQDGNYAGKFG